ncbi:hypothetical protein LTR15_011163 [Elasticomyces elasticus]|nr:hypothetical protein LTR15_011163 [Elasticomyces elasticus]
MSDDVVMEDQAASASATPGASASPGDPTSLQLGSVDQAGRSQPPSFTPEEIRTHHSLQLASVPDIWASTDGENYRAWETFMSKATAIQAPVPRAPEETRLVDLLDVFPVTKCYKNLSTKIVQVYDPKATAKDDPPEGIDPRFSKWIIFVSREQKIQSMQAKQPVTAITKRPYGSTTQQFHFPHDLSPTDMELIRRTLQHICEHCPMRLGSWQQAVRFEAVIADAALAICAPRSRIIVLPAISATSSVACHARVVYLDAALLSQTQLATSAPIANVAKTYLLQVSVPKDDAGLREAPRLSPIFAEPKLPPLYETIHNSAFKRVAEGVAWIVSQIHGSTGTAASLDLRVALCKEVLGIPSPETDLTGSLYRQDTLFVRTKTTSGYDLDPSAAVSSDIRGEPLNTIKVPADVDAVSRVVEAGEREFVQSGDAVLAWRKACQRADFEHALISGGKDAGPCHCQPSQKYFKAHLCRGCKSLTICEWLVDGLCPTCAINLPSCMQCAQEGHNCDKQTPICTRCAKEKRDCVYSGKGTSKSGKGKGAPKGGQGTEKRSAGVRRLLEAYRNNIRGDEANLVSIGSRSARQLAMNLKAQRGALCDELVAARPTLLSGEFQDEYLLTAVDLDQKGTSNGFTLSTDAMLPVSVSTRFGTNQWGTPHLPENIRLCERKYDYPYLEVYTDITTVFVNKLKGSFSHHVIACYSDLCKDHTEDELNEILKRLSHIYLVHLQYPYTTIARLQLPAENIDIVVNS